MKKQMKNMMGREEGAHTNQKRPERIPLGQGSKLTVAKHLLKPGYHAHWFIDRPGQLEGAKAAYYEFVRDENGQKITTPAGRGETHYLMHIEQRYYDEDMIKQQEMVTETTRAAIKVKKSKGEYSPEGEENSVTRDII